MKLNEITCFDDERLNKIANKSFLKMLGKCKCGRIGWELESVGYGDRQENFKKCKYCGNTENIDYSRSIWYKYEMPFFEDMEKELRKKIFMKTLNAMGKL